MAAFAPMIIIKSGVPNPAVIPITDSRTIIGKHPQCDIVLSNPFISRTHARLDIKNDKVQIRDLSSKNGTWVDGTKIGTTPSTLSDGSRIEFGQKQVTAVFSLSDRTVTLEAYATGQDDPAEVEFAIDERSRHVWINGETLSPALTRKEFDILFLLNLKRGNVCTHDEIARSGWPERSSEMVDESEIRQYILRLRSIFRSASTENIEISTSRGVGYRLDIS